MLRFKPLDDDRILYFIHIPKTGGSSFNNLLVQIYGHRHLFHADKDVREGKSSINELNSHKMKNIQVVTSHARYDFAKSILPEKKVSAITLIRNPVERVKSQINYIYSNPEHVLHRHIKEIVDQNLSFEKLFQRNANFSNLQSIMLSGEPDADKAIESVGQNIRLMGSTCRYGQFVTECSLLLGWNTDGLKLDERANKSSISLELDDSLILDYNREDQKLFEWYMKKVNL